MIAMESKDLTLSVPTCSLFPSCHEPRGMLSSGSDRILLEYQGSGNNLTQSLES